MMQSISTLLSGAETLAPAEGWRVGEGGSRNLSLLATLSRGPRLPSSASAKHIRFRVSEHLEASGVLHETLSQSQSALKYFVEEIKVPKYSFCIILWRNLRIIFILHVWLSCVTSKVKSSQSPWHSILWKWWHTAFLIENWCSFYLSSPVTSFLCSGIANFCQTLQ